MISHFSQEPFEGTLHIEDADLQKMAKVLNDVNIKECPYFDLSDKYGNSARYYRENQWTPCSESLPKEKSDVLVTISDGFSPFVDTDLWEGNRFFCYGNHRVEAWMPLPEPWKEAKE